MAGASISKKIEIDREAGYVVHRINLSGGKLLHGDRLHSSIKKYLENMTSKGTFMVLQTAGNEFSDPDRKTVKVGDIGSYMRTLLDTLVPVLDRGMFVVLVLGFPRFTAEETKNVLANNQAIITFLRGWFNSKNGGAQLSIIDPCTLLGGIEHVTDNFGGIMKKDGVHPTDGAMGYINEEISRRIVSFNALCVYDNRYLFGYESSWNSPAWVFKPWIKCLRPKQVFGTGVAMQHVVNNPRGAMRGRGVRNPWQGP